MFALLVTSSIAPFEIIAFIAYHAMFDTQERFSVSGGILHTAPLCCSPRDSFLCRIHLSLRFRSRGCFQRGIALCGRVLRISLATATTFLLLEIRSRTTGLVSVLITTINHHLTCLLIRPLGGSI